MLDSVLRLRVIHDVDEWVDATDAENKVAVLGAVAGDVSDRPNGLLGDVAEGRGEELHEEVDAAFVDDGLRLLRGAARDVGECP